MSSPVIERPAIEVVGIRKSFGDLEVLRGVNLTVAEGSITALLGTNGAGKSTLVRILSTLLDADADADADAGTGSARVLGSDVAHEPGEVRKKISLTGQFAAVDGILTGRENIELIARLRHERDPKRVARDLLDRFALTDAADRPAAGYSGGMRRRLDIAMSLVGDPAVIFLDEPTTGLDPEARIEVWDTIRQLVARGATVLLTTQYLEEAEALADRIAILHGGRILREGTLQELRDSLPAAPVEMVQKQRTLEDIFLALIGRGDEAPASSGPEQKEQER